MVEGLQQVLAKLLLLPNQTVTGEELITFLRNGGTQQMENLIGQQQDVSEFLTTEFLSKLGVALNYMRSDRQAFGNSPA